MRPSGLERGLNRWPRGCPERSWSPKHCAQKSKSSQSRHFMTRPTRGGPAPQPSHVTCRWTAASPLPSPSSSCSAASAAAAAREKARGLEPPAPWWRPLPRSAGAPERSTCATAACKEAVACWRPSSWRCSSASSRARASSGRRLAAELWPEPSPRGFRPDPWPARTAEREEACPTREPDPAALDGCCWCRERLEPPSDWLPPLPRAAPREPPLPPRPTA
mmetsp:Transcript_135840/g.421980  ORF Transcript_135840/g.421980 Transcript_135840/m.421980 type:complete len:220 (+) Transcript_135840:518-1177(+)